MLKVNAECSKKFFQDACIVTCREGGQLIGEAEIKCEYTGQWSSFPHCACPIPIPSNDLILKNCSTKIPGENCFAECKENFKLIGDASLLCQKNTKWSIMPKCIPKICPSPFVPEYLEIKRNCSSKKIGEFCEVSCKHGGKVSGTNTMQCLPTTAWSSLPDCTCPVPKITQSLVTLKENCNFKKRYEHCAVACPQGYAVQTDGAFACLPNATWSSLPLCVKTHCSLPTLDREILKEEENCTFKKIGDTCRVQCVQGGRLLVPKNLTCLRGGNWSSFPRCTCPILTISNDLSVLQDCNDANPGFQCFVECKETLKLNGKNYILCMNNSKWSVQPKCVKTICPNLVLQGDLLVLKEVCSAKTIGDKCQVGCKNGGNLITGKEMECLKDFQWSKPPDCTCASPNVSESIQLITQCDSIPKREKCFVLCKSGYDIGGINYATCQNNGKWGAFPSCLKKSCPEPALSSSMLKVNAECSKKFFQDACIVTCREGGQLIGEAEIKCEYTGQWSSFPHCACPIPIPSNDLILKNCSTKIPGENCFAECKENFKLIGDASLLCQKNTKWSIMPKCIPKICPSPFVPEYLEIKRNCSSKKIGEFCEVSCKHGGKVSGTNTMQCLPTTAWSSLPDCTCPVPKITQSLVTLKENCNFKKRYEHCAVACPQGYAVQTDGAFACLPNATWSSLPLCVKTHCSLPTLDREILKEEENCTFKKIGDTCRVQCVQGGRLLVPKNLTCLRGGNWSSFPRCTCPILTISNDLSVLQDCNDANPGFQCFVECKETLKLNGKNYILCMNNSKWSVQPKCVKTICPNLVLQGDLLVLKEVCSAKTIGDKCQVGCKNGGNLITGKEMECLKDFQWSKPPDCTCASPNVSESIQLITQCDSIPKREKCFVLCKSGYDIGGINYATCQNNGKWGAFPSCLKKSCPEPALSSSMLKVNAECSKKFFQDACIVTCREGGQLIGEAEIKCEYTGQWSSFPHCACPIPIPSNDLILKNCSTKIPGENCFAECKENFKLIGDASLLCQKNTKWSIMPKCIPKICPSPFVPEYLEIKRNCSSKKIGEFCEVSCKHGGKVSGTNTMQCLPTTAWSSLPDCTCPVPKITQSLVTLKENCNFKKRYEHCAVACPQGYAVQTDGAFACLPNATWSSLPLCVKTHCSLPTLDREILKEEENCTFKKIGDTCRVQCVQGGRLLVPKNLTCLRGGNWSSFPRCTCPILTISNDLSVLQDCNDANPGFQCFVECKETLKLNGKNYILCMNNSKWSVQPKCVKTICPNLVLQGDLLVLKEVCSAKTIGDKCQVGCKNGGNLITGKEMECLKDFQWSKPPDCTCASPNVSESIQLITQCDSIPKREKCFVLCKSGYDIAGINYATCQNNGKWGAFPSCLKKSCPEPALSSSMLKVNAECSKKFFQDACIVTCREGGQLIGEAEIKCEYTGQWSSFPHCACTIPIPSNDLILKNCSTKIPGENCFAECKENFKLIGDAFLLCQKNTKWSIMPKCIPKICPSPYLQTWRKSLGTNTTQCLPTTAWSSLPDCTCPVPKITQSLVTLKENCNFKKRYEHCAVACPQGYAVQTDGAFACLPNATWSSLPLCVKTHCSLPTLDREILKEEENCTFKKIGDTCRVQCVQGGRLLVPKKLTCLRGGNWSSFPRCTCPILTISNDLSVLQDCNDANPGFQCFVECKETLKLNGKNYILCMNNSKWSVQPKCVKTVCPNLVLRGDLLVLKEVCSAKTIGDKCQVGCKNGGNLITGKEMECLKDFQWSKPPDCTCASPNVSESIQLITQCDSIPKREKCFVRCKIGYDIAGINYATCQNNGKWGAFPSCLKKSCPEPALSSSMLKVNAECSKKFFQDACIVTCREGGQLIGEAEIKCEYTGQWSSFPHCACTIPIPSNDLILKNCSTKIPGENCFAECKENFKLIGDASLLCQKNTKWSIMPKCIPKICPSPFVPEYLEIKRNCSSKNIGEFCSEVSCKHGGKVSGTNTMQCLPTTAWSSLPDCTCPVPKITQSLVTLKENCNFKKRYEHCAVACPQGYAVQTDGAFACLPNATWSSLPLCVKTHCSLPTLDREILKEEENCTFKKIGDTCRVQCVQGGRLLVPKKLTCLRGGNWSSFPRCTCPILTISNDLSVLQDCNDANPGFQCFVECKETLKLNGKNYILCMNNSKWSVQPKCVKTVCPNLVLQGDLLVLKEVCSAKTIGDKCQVGCKNGGNLITGKEMECLKDFQWSKSPDCTCASPNVSESIQLINTV
ncbi:sushi, von Willebrand factor type A, EGF and pentraxin domain-containing protein 1 [Trichonephila clavata]|uniref:Sushi, von Willebrand factor type A, EGF and pentraxin domain-containing protein 1 n=1 Tax=Trichonephila clavata TaxID=2740835 RepID=A0A8X6J3A7_TRICU|nr:sushi, von Willebrand factor type A, EGF and pentraxin domain-containing protein 1 [Trichonephila clavata]